RGNAMVGNFGKGIDLGANGNDPGDADAGPNNLQNTPDLAEASLVGPNQLRVNFTVPTAADTAAYPLTVDFYLADPSGEGQVYLGLLIYTTPTLPAQGVLTLNTPVSPGQRLVATATDALGNTSEFSAPRQITVPPRLTPSPG